MKESLLSPVNWYYKAADQGHANAQYKLGLCCLYGNGVIKDEKIAAQWLQLAASQGHIDAQKALKNMGY